LGLIFNTQPLSIHDGPGIRTTVFLKGCPLRCEWCSNPDSWHPFPEIMTRDTKCLRCGCCAKACPARAITITEDARDIDRAKCGRCIECGSACLNGAIHVSGETVEVDELVREVAKDELFFKNSGGGLTLSGGEPLLQWEFVAQVFEACKKRGIHTALDTTGYAAWEQLDAVLNYSDLVLYDVKHMDPEIHLRRTGVSNALILENLSKTARRVRTWIRIPIIPGFNDTDSDLRRIVDYVAALPVEKVSILPYHGWGQAKFEALGSEYPLTEISPPLDERIEEICTIVKSAGFECTVKY
jgi:pyruvate formate lyase activating enzyme